MVTSGSAFFALFGIRHSTQDVIADLLSRFPLPLVPRHQFQIRLNGGGVFNAILPSRIEVRKLFSCIGQIDVWKAVGLLEFHSQRRKQVFGAALQYAATMGSRARTEYLAADAAPVIEKAI